MHTRRLIQERNPVSAVTSGKPLAASHTLYTRELIQEKNHMNVVNMGKLSFGAFHCLLYMTECMKDQTPINVISVKILQGEITAPFTSENAHDKEAL